MHNNYFIQFFPLKNINKVQTISLLGWNELRLTRGYFLAVYRLETRVKNIHTYIIIMKTVRMMTKVMGELLSGIVATYLSKTWRTSVTAA